MVTPQCLAAVSLDRPDHRQYGHSDHVRQPRPRFCEFPQVRLCIGSKR